jgi:hypothetical protein
VALDTVRRPKTTPIHELERYMRCKDCSLACEAWSKRMLAFKGPAQPLQQRTRPLGGRRCRRACRGIWCPWRGRMRRGARLSFQAQPSSRTAAHQDFSE